MAAFTTRTKVKTQLGIPAAVTQHDQRVDDLLDAVDTEMYGLIGQSAITSTVYNETYDIDGAGENAIALRHWPATSVAAITDDGSAVTVSDTYIDPESRSYLRYKDRAAFWTQGRQKVQVTYTAGHVSVPDDLALAAAMLCVARFNASGHAGLESESAGGYSYRRAQGADAYYPPEVRAIVARYRPLFPRP